VLGLHRHLPAIGTPLLALHGKDDARVEWQQSVRLHELVGSADKTLVLYEGVRHQLLQVGGHAAVRCMPVSGSGAAGSRPH
jgi:alpha-beta hydrolase superfamily lysophospholipase